MGFPDQLSHARQIRPAQRHHVPLQSLQDRRLMMRILGQHPHQSIPDELFRRSEARRTSPPG